MTTYYIHWWLAFKETEKNLIFFRTFLSDYRLGENILFIPFAKDNHNEVLNYFENTINNYTWNKYSIELAIEDKSTLINQINNSKYIYIHGWDYIKLYSKLEFLIDHKDIFKWKKVIVSSAWTNLLAKYSYANDYWRIQKWLWFLNILTFCHYKWKDEWKKLLEDLQTNLPIYCLNEWEFQKINVE